MDEYIVIGFSNELVVKCPNCGLIIIVRWALNPINFRKKVIKCDGCGFNRTIDNILDDYLRKR